MAHNARLYPDATYVSGYVVTGNDFKFFDTNITKSVNGDGGGTWSPTGRIFIGGAGMVLALATTMTNGADVLTSSGNYVEHDDGDYIQFATTRTIMSPAIRGRSLTLTNALADNLPAWNVDLTKGLVSGRSGSQGASFLTAPPRWQFPLRVHDGAILSQVFFYYQLGMSHSAYPTNPLRFRAMRFDRDGNAVQLLTGVPSTSIVANSSGYVPLPAASYGTTSASELTCNVDPNYAAVDLSKYRYVAEIADEYGKNAWTGGNATLFFGAAASHTIADMRPQ